MALGSARWAVYNSSLGEGRLNEGRLNHVQRFGVGDKVKLRIIECANPASMGCFWPATDHYSYVQLEYLGDW